MSSKDDSSASSKQSKITKQGLESRPTQHGSDAPDSSTAPPAKTSVPSAKKKDPMAIHASTFIPRGQTMAPKTMAGSAASMRKLPSASMPPVAKPPTSKSMAPKAMRGTQLHRDGTTTQQPMEHHGTKLNRDDIPRGTKLNRDDIPRGNKLNRDEISRGTKLNRDDIPVDTKLNRDDVSLGTTFNRDDVPQGTMLLRDGPSMQPKTMAPPGTKSIFISPHDITMATRQTVIDDLLPDERDEQEEWAQELIKRSGACPQGYDWNRQDGGYQCHGGGHGITDDILAEGRGGMWSLPTKDWEDKVGPYYPRDGEWFRVKSDAPGS